jgi:hypothetical protein
MTHYARFKTGQAYISSEFGETMARRYFGNEVVDAMPRYVRGNRKGQFKGQIVWTKVIQGGWVRTGAYAADYGPSGYPERRVNQTIEAVLSIPEWRSDATVVAEWKWHEMDMNDRNKACVHIKESSAA